MQVFVSVFSILIGIAILAFAALRYFNVRQMVVDRLDNDSLDGSERSTATLDPTQQSWIRGWLFRAGFRRNNAVVLFWITELGFAMVAFGLLFWTWSQGYFQLASQFITSIPGGVGNVLVPIVLATPWFLVAVIILIPVLYVRSIRRQRVQSIEKDLPLLLDLLETLSQAGVGYDSALDRILDVQNQNRPLVAEMREYQFDNLAGRSRVDSLRRLMRRVDVAMFSTFISAIIQAEQTGATISSTMKTQSAEMRARRREKATAAAMSVPTLLVVPMVIGFLPGIFVILLGPMLYESLGVLEQNFRGVLGQ